MERELKEFLDACLREPSEKEPEFNINALTNVSGQSRMIAARKKTSKKHGFESGLFSLGARFGERTTILWWLETAGLKMTNRVIRLVE